MVSCSSFRPKADGREGNLQWKSRAEDTSWIPDKDPYLINSISRAVLSQSHQGQDKAGPQKVPDRPF